MRVLVLTPTFPPNSGSHVQRMLKMANVLVECGFEIFVFTAEITKMHPKYSEDMINDINSDIHIVKAPLGKLHQKVYSDFHEDSERFHNKTNTSSNSVKSTIYNFGQQIKRKVLIPDTMVDWVPVVIRHEKKYKIIETIKPDLILSCSQPSSVHLAGYHFSKKYNIPLYMDYADPWVYLEDYNENTIRFKIEKRIEKRILNHAIGLSFSAPGCLELYYEKYSIPKEKMTVAMSGYEEKLVEKSKEGFIIPNENKISFTYGGALQSNVRDPKPFFRIAKEFEEQISVDIRTSNVTEVCDWLNGEGNAHCVSIKSYLPFNSYYNEMLTKDVILFFGNTNNIQIPGKIFNCLATGKHIFYIKSNNDGYDSVETILKEYGKSTIVNNDDESIRKGLESIIDGLNSVRTAPKWDLNAISVYSDTNQYKHLASHIMKMIGEVKK